MKKLLAVLIILAVCVVGIWAQDTAAAAKPAQVSLGNNLIFEGNMIYTPLGNPVTRFAVGYDMSLKPNLIATATVGVVSQQNQGQDFIFGTTTATSDEGESNYAFAGIGLKFLISSFFVSTGFDYQAFTHGYIVSGGATPVYADLTRSVVTDSLIAHFGFGYYAKIANNLMLVPALNLSYALPTKSSFAFKATDIGIGLGLGLAINMSDK